MVALCKGLGGNGPGGGLGGCRRGRLLRCLGHGRNVGTFIGIGTGSGRAAHGFLQSTPPETIHQKCHYGADRRRTAKVAVNDKPDIAADLFPL
jgi:hypothetical protein